jgi:hypothetical protein
MIQLIPHSRQGKTKRNKSVVARDWGGEIRKDKGEFLRAIELFCILKIMVCAYIAI